MPNGSLKRLRHSNGKEWVWRRYAMFCFKLCEGLGQPEKQFEIVVDLKFVNGWLLISPCGGADLLM